INLLIEYDVQYYNVNYSLISNAYPNSVATVYSPIQQKDIMVESAFNETAYIYYNGNFEYKFTVNSGYSINRVIIDNVVYVGDTETEDTLPLSTFFSLPNLTQNTDENLHQYVFVFEDGGLITRAHSIIVELKISTARISVHFDVLNSRSGETTATNKDNNEHLYDDITSMYKVKDYYDYQNNEIFSDIDKVNNFSYNYNYFDNEVISIVACEGHYIYSVNIRNLATGQLVYVYKFEGDSRNDELISYLEWECDSILADYSITAMFKVKEYKVTYHVSSDVKLVENVEDFVTVILYQNKYYDDDSKVALESFARETVSYIEYNAEVSMSVKLSDFIVNNYHYKLNTISYYTYNRVAEDFVTADITLPENSTEYVTNEQGYELKLINDLEIYITLTVENFEITTEINSIKATSSYTNSDIRAFVNGEEVVVENYKLQYKFGDIIDFYVKKADRNTISGVNLTGEKQLKMYSVVTNPTKFEKTTLDGVEYEVFHIEPSDDLYKFTLLTFVAESEFVTVNISFATETFARIEEAHGYFTLTDNTTNKVCDLLTGEPITDYSIEYRNSIGFRLYIDGQFTINMYADEHYHLVDVGVKNSSTGSYESGFGSEWSSGITMNADLMSAVFKGDYNTTKEILICIDIDSFDVTINKNDDKVGGKYKYLVDSKSTVNSVLDSETTFQVDYGSNFDVLIYEYLSQNEAFGVELKSITIDKNNIKREVTFENIDTFTDLMMFEFVQKETSTVFGIRYKNYSLLNTFVDSNMTITLNFIEKTIEVKAEIIADSGAGAIFTNTSDFVLVGTNNTDTYLTINVDFNSSVDFRFGFNNGFAVKNVDIVAYNGLISTIDGLTISNSVSLTEIVGLTTVRIYIEKYHIEAKWTINSPDSDSTNQIAQQTKMLVAKTQESAETITQNGVLDSTCISSSFLNGLNVYYGNYVKVFVPKVENLAFNGFTMIALGEVLDSQKGITELSYIANGDYYSVIVPIQGKYGSSYEIIANYSNYVNIRIYAITNEDVNTIANNNKGGRFTVIDSYNVETSAYSTYEMSVKMDTQFTIKAYANENYIFDQFYIKNLVGKHYDNESLVSFNEDTVIYVNFVEKYNINVNIMVDGNLQTDNVVVNPNNIVITSDYVDSEGNPIICHGATISLELGEIKAGYVFKNWTYQGTEYQNEKLSIENVNGNVLCFVYVEADKIVISGTISEGANGKLTSNSIDSQITLLSYTLTYNYGDRVEITLPVAKSTYDLIDDTLEDYLPTNATYQKESRKIIIPSVNSSFNLDIIFKKKVTITIYPAT
ncbi:MAG: hypothetical protein IJW82_00970, partial [Clostridia bacterium]|nr:hypothetical protein [Clostridia bacterium]